MSVLDGPTNLEAGSSNILTYPVLASLYVQGRHSVLQTGLYVQYI
jgi:hypothetical protein